MAAASHACSMPLAMERSRTAWDITAVRDKTHDKRCCFCPCSIGKDATTNYKEGIDQGFNICSRLLQVCVKDRAPAKGKGVHANIIKTGLNADVFVANNLVNMYAKFGNLLDACQLFDEMPVRTLVSWTVMITGYAQNGFREQALRWFCRMLSLGIKPNNFTFVSVMRICEIDEGEQVHAHVIKTGLQSDVSVGNSQLTMYAKCGRIENARKVFDKMLERDVPLWNAMISGYTQNGFGEEALKLFCEMESEACIKPNQLTLTSVLKAITIARLAALDNGKAVHGRIIKSGYESDVFVGSGLVDMYAKCGKVEDARQLFDKMPERNMVSWNIMVAGYAQDGDGEKTFEFFRKMQVAGMKPDRFSFMSVLGAAPLEEGRQVHARLIKTGVESHLSVGNALIAMYAKCRSLENASKVFMEMAETNVVSYTAVIGGYAQNGHAKEVVELFCQMQWADIDPDQFTFASVLSACANFASLEQGKQLHTRIIKTGFDLNVTVGNSLVTMYAKCGSIQEAHKVFEEMPQRNVLSWTSIITGFAQNGRSKDALERFEEMQLAGMKPNHITFVGVLSACSHAGLLDKGRHYFESMVHDHGIPQAMEHYACMVDLLGRAGLLDEAESFISKMPLEPSVSVWRALLGACRIHGNVGLGKCVVERILELDPQDATAYVLLANIYAAAGRWADVAKVRKTMKDKGIRKEAGCSWIVIKNRVHTFVAGDRSHPEMDEIYSQVENLMEQIKKAGHVPDTTLVLHGVEEEREENTLPP